MTPTHTVYKSLRDFTTTFSASPYNHFPRRSRGLSRRRRRRYLVCAPISREKKFRWAAEVRPREEHG